MFIKLDIQGEYPIEKNDDNYPENEDNVPMEYICVAPTEELALAAFKRYHNYDYIKNVVCTKLYNLDDLVYLQ